MLAGMPKLDIGVDAFLLAQQLVPDPTLVDELRCALARALGNDEPSPPSAGPFTVPKTGMQGSLS